MSTLFLCQGKRAKTPFVINTIGKSIYTIEELCFYLHKYIHLVEDSLFDARLTGWIKKQLQLEQLSEQLERQIKKGEQFEELIRTVFSYVSYMDKDSFELFYEQIIQIKNLSALERKKRKADDLVRSRKYYQALQEYEALLKEVGEKDQETVSKIYHNIAVAYGRMFYMEQAGEYFLKAFLAVPNRESLRQYKTAIRLCDENIEEDELVKAFPGAEAMDIQVYEDIQNVNVKSSAKKEEILSLRKMKNEGKISDYYEKLEEILQRWQEECRDYMNVSLH